MIEANTDGRELRAMAFSLLENIEKVKSIDAKAVIAEAFNILIDASNKL